MNPQRIVLPFIFLLCLGACKKAATSDCGRVKYKRVHAERIQNIDNLSYLHYIQLSDYVNDCFAQIQFSTVAKRYVDTCKVMLPIEGIIFIKSVEDTGLMEGELHPKKIIEHELISFDIDSTR